MSSEFLHTSPWSQEKKIYIYSSAQDIEDTLSQLTSSQKSWSALPFDQRKKVLEQVVQRLRDCSERLAELASYEMGKPLLQARQEVQKCLVTFEWVLSEGLGFFPQDQDLVGNYSCSYLKYVPRGLILAIMPWNFPFWQICRASVFSLLQGNVILFKHSELVPESSRLWGSCFPADLLRSVCVPVSQIPRLIEDHRVNSVTLTGSVAAGQAVARLCAPLMKHTVLELGGSDVHLVFEDADLGRAADLILQSRIQNNGQSCIAAKRVLVSQKLQQDFLELLLEKSKKVVLGDPQNSSTQLSVLAHLRFKEQFQAQVNQIFKSGGRQLFRGENLEHPLFFPLHWLQVDSLNCAEWKSFEFFCPVGLFDTFESDHEALLKANRCDFGLGASLYTADVERAQLLSSGLEVGHVVINDFLKSDVRIPFSGSKLSGLGYELGHLGAKEFVTARVSSIAAVKAHSG